MSPTPRCFVDGLIPSTIDNARRLPFYEEFWEHTEPEQVRTVDDLQLLPLMDRADYLERSHLFWTEEMLGRHFLVSHTSGTTGELLTRYRSAEEVDYIRRFFTALQRRGRASSGDAPTIVQIAAAEAVHGDVIPIPYPGTVLSLPMDAPADIECLVEVLARPQHVAGQPRCVEVLGIPVDQLVVLSSVLAERGVDPKQAFHLRRISTCGGYLNTGAARRISAFWGIPVNDQFSLSEIFGGARNCLACGWYHFDPLVAAEVVDHRTGVPLTGGCGILVLTELFPFVQAHPFVRYWTGDVIEATPSRCDGSCLAFRYLGRTHGRPGRAPRAPLRLKGGQETEGVLLDVDGEILVRPGPLLDFLGDREGVARWAVGGESGDPLGLGTPRFTLAFEPGQPSAVRLCVSVDRPEELPPALAERLHAVLLGHNPELALRSARGELAIDVVFHQCKQEADR
jgi:hypothetical protein